MEPTLIAGQTVAIEFSPQRVSRGELLLFRQSDYLAVHRLLGGARLPGGGRGHRTRGDGVSRLDPPVAPASVVGKVLAIESDGQWRDLRGARARAYGLAVAAHDLWWAAVDAVATALDRRLSGNAEDGLLHRLTSRCDRGTLRVAHRLFFASCHPRVDLSAIE